MSIQQAGLGPRGYLGGNGFPPGENTPLIISSENHSSEGATSPMLTYGGVSGGKQEKTGIENEGGGGGDDRTEIERSDLHKNKDFQLIEVPQDAVSEHAQR